MTTNRMSEDDRVAMRKFLLGRAYHEFQFNPLADVESVEVVVRSTEVNLTAGKKTVLNGMAIARISHDSDEPDAVGLMVTNSYEMADEALLAVVFFDREEALALLRVAERTWPGILSEAAE